MKLNLLGCCAALVVAMAGNALPSEAAQDLRPPFDKSDYKGRVGIQLNPWFPPKKMPIHGYGGPNRPYIHHEGGTWDVWRQAMELCAKYGVDTLVPEINEPVHYAWNWSKMLEAAGTNNPPVKIGMFFGFYSKDKDACIASMKKVLGPYRELLKDHPAVLRAGGHPVMVVYAWHFPMAEMKEIFDALDAEFGRMVYLLNVNVFAVKAAREGGSVESQDARFEKYLREALPYWDGISSYGTGFRVPFDVIKKVMRDFPQKINEGEALFTYLCHFQMGGSEVDLSKTWRDRLAGCYSSDPDAIMLTNLLDQYENSAVYPCYEREDLILRYLEWTLEKWKGRKFTRRKEPELVVCNPVSVLLGWQNLDFEVLGFPFDAPATDVYVTLDVCDTSGKPLHSFAERRMDCNTFRAERFSLPSTQFAGERGVVPRLRYRWAGQDRAMNYGSMTLIAPSLRPFRLFWARSTKNELLVTAKNEWTLDKTGVGGTHHPSPTGHARFSARIGPTWHGGAVSGSSRAGIRRDGLEFLYAEDESRGLLREITVQTPRPGSALHWYHLEMENTGGHKYRTLPIWETDGSCDTPVVLPVKKEDGTIVDFTIEGVRVPFWHYPVEEDYGRILLDVSGWDHHGHILSGDAAYGGGHLGYTGYNHYHNGYTEPSSGKEYRSLFKRDASGRGYLALDGTNDYVQVMGGTAFPGASTYEISVRPAELGREMGVVCTANNQINIVLMPDGTLHVSRESSTGETGGDTPPRTVSRTVTSTSRLTPGEWTKIAVTYDLRKLRLYLNGKLEGESEVAPVKGHEWINFVMIGAKCRTLIGNAKNHFKGDVRAIRMYGRNLAPSELM